MATSGSVSSNQYNNRGIEFTWSRTSYSSSNNTTTIYYELKGNGSRSGYYMSGPFYILAYYGGANHEIYYSDSRIQLYNGTLIKSDYITIPMNNDGSGGFSIYIEAGIYTYAVNVSGQKEFTLDKIPRYANISNFTVSQVDETSVKFNWSTNATCDYAWYSKDNGSSWTGYNITDGTSGNFNVSGLSANTSYNFKLRVRRKDSQLTTDSSTVSQTTYDYPKPTVVNNFTIGNGGNIAYLENPLGRNCTLQAISNKNGAVIASYTGTYSGYIGAEFVTQEAIDAQYASIPDSKSGTYYVKVTYSGHVKTSGNATYSIKNTEVPTFTNWEYYDIDEKTQMLTGNNKILIKGYSKLLGIVSVADKMIANNSAEPYIYKLSTSSAEAQSFYDSRYDVYVPSGATSNLTVNENSFTMYAVDTRGLSTPVTKSASASNFKNYSKILITSASVHRTGNVGSETTLNLSGNIWNDNFGDVQNSIQNFIIEYKLSNQPDSDYQRITVIGQPTLSGNTFSYSHIINGDLGAEGYTIAQSFNIRVYISDELSHDTTVLTLGTGTPNIAIAPKGVAIGTPYDETLLGLLQFLPNQYFPDGAAINLNNSDIINANCFWFNDESTGNEGLNFLKQNGDKTNPQDYETLRGYRGNLYYNEKILAFRDELFYKVNETQVLGTACISPGHITSGKTTLAFTIIPPKNMKDISNIVFTAGTITVRGLAGYVDDSYTNPIPLTGSSTYIPTLVKRNDGYIHVNLSKDSGYSNVDNNTPVTIYMNGVNIKFT